MLASSCCRSVGSPSWRALRLLAPLGRRCSSERRNCWCPRETPSFRQGIVRDGRMFRYRLRQMRRKQLRVGLNGLNKLALFPVQLLGGVAGQTRKDRKLFVRHKVDPLSEDGAGRRVFICRGLWRGLFIQQASPRIIRIFAWRDGLPSQQGGDQLMRIPVVQCEQSKRYSQKCGQSNSCSL